MDKGGTRDRSADGSAVLSGRNTRPAGARVLDLQDGTEIGKIRLLLGLTHLEGEPIPSQHGW